MRRLFQDLWQTGAVAFFTALLALQIPRKALFFEGRAERQAEGAVEVVPLEAGEYEAVVQSIRMAWQVRGRGAWGMERDSRTDAIDLAGDEPEPEYMELPADFGAERMEFGGVPGRVELLPETRGEAMPSAAGGAGGRERDKELLAWPESVGF